MAKLSQTQVSELYVLLFNMASEGDGNEYWQGVSEEHDTTTLIDHMLFASSEHGVLVDGLGSREFVETLYQNAYGRTADEDGIAYWTEQLETGALNKGGVVWNILEALKEEQTDLVALANQQIFNNRVEVSNYFADNQAEKISNEEQGFGEGQGLAGVTADVATVDAAKVAVDKIVAEAGQDTSELTEALENLQNAQLAKSEFLKEAAEIASVKAAAGATTEAKIAAAVSAADTALGVVSYEDSAGATQTFNVYAAGAVSAGGDSDGVKAAKVADAEAARAKDLKDAQEDLAAAQAEVAKVSGLKSAIDLYNARVEAQKVTAEALKAAKVVEASAQGAYDAQNAAIVPNPTTGVVASVIVQNATSGRLELASGVTETTNPGIGALLAAVQARVDAAGIDKQAQDAIEAAVIAIGYIDTATTAKDAIAVAIDSSNNGLGDGDELTQSEIQVALNAQLAAAQSAFEAAGGTGDLTVDAAGEISTADLDASGTGATTPEEDTFNTAKADFNTLKGAVNTFEITLVASFANAAKTKAQIDAQVDVADAELAIEALAKAVADLEAVKEVAGELKGLNDAIDAAEDAFEDLGFEAPVTISGTVVGTAENDLFLISDTAGTVVNFNAQGEDSIFVGTDFAELQVLAASEVVTGRVGDASVLEIFAKQNGSNVDLWVEQEAFAGTATGDADLVKITLAGVSVNDLMLEDGYLTIA